MFVAKWKVRRRVWKQRWDWARRLSEEKGRKVREAWPEQQWAGTQGHWKAFQEALS